MNLDKIGVLIVDDDEVDIEAVERELSSRNLPVRTFVANDGVEALQVLRSEEFTPYLQASVILLDLNMPGMTGTEFLTELRLDPLLRRMLVFVLTTSDHIRDRQAVYDQNVCGYFLKNNLGSIIDTFENFTRVVRFPPVAP